MATHTLFGRAHAVNFSEIAAFAAVAAAWDTAAFNGDTGTISVPNTAGLPKIALEITGAALDDSVIPAGATILTARAAFDWSATADGANTWGLTSVAAPTVPVTITTSASGHLDTVLVDFGVGISRADFFDLITQWEWKLDLSATDGLTHNFRIVITNWAITVTYSAPPVETSATPDSGPVAGGTLVTITGTDFNSATAVTFDGLAAAFAVISDTTLTAVSPSHAAGLVTIAIVGTGRTVAFTYVLTKTLLPPVPRLH
jgi:IPT/TIG domain-containing protein